MMLLTVNKRQVHETKGSYYIYLPKEWIIKNQIDKGENKKKSLTLIEYFDDSLILKNDPENQKDYPVNISLDKISTDKNTLQNYIIASYVIGANKITIYSEKDAINALTREEISQQIRDLPGFEIIEENDTTIVAKEIGQILDITSIIQTLFSTTTVMFKAIQELISNESKDEETLKRELKAIIKRDDDVDRYRHMVDRQSHLILSDPYLISVQKLNPISALHDSQIASHIERIADHIVELAKFVRLNVNDIKNIKDLKLDLKKNLYEHINEGIKYFNQLMDINKKKDYLEALKLFKDIHEYEKSIQKRLKTEEFNFGIYHLGRIFSYCENIAEILINNTSYEEMEKFY